MEPEAVLRSFHVSRLGLLVLSSLWSRVYLLYTVYGLDEAVHTWPECMAEPESLLLLSRPWIPAPHCWTRVQWYGVVSLVCMLCNYLHMYAIQLYYTPPGPLDWSVWYQSLNLIS